MAQRIVTCGRCGRERYESRMVQGVRILHYNYYTGQPDAFRPVDYWECFSGASCGKARKERNRRMRKEKEQQDV
jgi:ribosomal protein L37E